MRNLRRVLLPLLFVIFGMSLTSCQKSISLQEKNSIRIGITVYDVYDTFISELTSHFTRIVQENEADMNMTITILIEGADGSQEAQNNQVENFVEMGCDVICVNLVDRTNAAVIIDKANAAGIPVIFFNRELVEEDLNRSDNLFYVGSDANGSGRIQGEILGEYVEKNFASVDHNGDGILQYVMLEGEAGHQDAIVRTALSVQTLSGYGCPLERLDRDIANWLRSRAESKVNQWIESYGSDIEIILANNDDMALGAIDAYKRAEISSNQWPLIVGTDGTEVGLHAVLVGEMLGTAYNNSYAQAKGMFDLSIALALNQEMPPELDGKYIRIPYEKITKDNVLSYIKRNP